MRTAIYKTILAGVIASIALTGCGMGGKPVVLRTPTMKVDNGVKEIELQINKFSDSIKADSIPERQVIARQKGLKLAFDEAAKETLKEGKTHFVVLNGGNNAFNGFPLNTLNDLNHYCFASYYTKKEMKSKCGNIVKFNNGYVNLKFYPISNPPYAIAAFNAEDILKEEIKK